MKIDPLPSSFRDPSGFLFERDSVLYRQINKAYAPDYKKLMESGLYKTLVKAGLLINHQEVDFDKAANDQAYRVIRPDRISYISYPHEWCFSQLKDAALTTMRIQRIALKFGMTLKDASAYNIQFLQGRAILIDTLSFTQYKEGEPWLAYRQFCQHFLAPLTLMSLKDIRLNQLLRIHIDGIPLDLASSLLPRSSYLNFSILSHIHLHARAQKKHANASSKETKPNVRKISRKSFSAFLLSLHNSVRKIHWRLPNTEWGNYYTQTNYQDAAMDHKQSLVKSHLEQIDARQLLVHDLGANNGRFSRLASGLGYSTISQDIDPVAVETNYLQTQKDHEQNLLPLLLDLTNPTPRQGWSSEERMSLLDRSNGQIVLALALIHHLAISNNVPLNLIAKFFAKVAKYLIIEFVPKSDSQVLRLLHSREDIFDNYTQAEFETTFENYFTITQRSLIQESDRVLYLMERFD